MEEVYEIEEYLYVTIMRGHRQLGVCFDVVCLHLNALWADNEADESNRFGVEHAFQ